MHLFRPCDEQGVVICNYRLKGMCVNEKQIYQKSPTSVVEDHNLDKKKWKRVPRVEQNLCWSKSPLS